VRQLLLTIAISACCGNAFHVTQPPQSAGAFGAVRVDPFTVDASAARDERERARADKLAADLTSYVATRLGKTYHTGGATLVVGGHITSYRAHWIGNGAVTVEVVFSDQAGQVLARGNINGNPNAGGGIASCTTCEELGDGLTDFARDRFPAAR